MLYGQHRSRRWREARFWSRGTPGLAQDMGNGAGRDRDVPGDRARNSREFQASAHRIRPRTWRRISSGIGRASIPGRTQIPASHTEAPVQATIASINATIGCSARAASARERMQPSKLAVRAVIVIDWLITVGGDGSQQVYARPIGLTCVDRPCGGRIAIAICGPFCPVLPRFGLNNVAPWLHHRPVKGAVSHSVTQVKDKLRSRRLPGPAMGV